MQEVTGVFDDCRGELVVEECLYSFGQFDDDAAVITTVQVQRRHLDLERNNRRSLARFEIVEGKLLEQTRFSMF